MECGFVIFHTNTILYDRNVKDLCKLVYIAIIHTFPSYFIDDVNLLDYLSDLLNVSIRSIYRALKDLVYFNYLYKCNKYSWRVNDFRFDIDEN